MQQLDVFLQSETKSFVDILFKVIDAKEYVNPPTEVPATEPLPDPPAVKQEEEKEEPEEPEPEPEEPKKVQEEAKPEADSTTPIREPETKLKEELRRKSPFPDPDRPGRRFRSSPPPPLMSDRLGPVRPRRHDRPIRSPPRRFRSRSPSPRHDRFRPVRRRTRSPPRFRGAARSFSR